jgi:hypothetical protein
MNPNVPLAAVPFYTVGDDEQMTIEKQTFSVSEEYFDTLCPDRCCHIDLRSRLLPVANFRITGEYIHETYVTFHGQIRVVMSSYRIGESEARKSVEFDAYSVKVGTEKWHEAYGELLTSFGEQRIHSNEE